MSRHDMFEEVASDELRPAALALWHDLCGTGQGEFSMISTSGTGKSSAIIDAGRRHFIVFVQASLPTSTVNANDPNKVARISREFDTEFATMVTDIRRMLINNTEDENILRDNYEMARIRGKQELIARLLQLVRMHVDATDAGRALEPWDFMLQQQAGPQTYVVDALKMVKKCDDDQLETIAQLIRLELAPILNEKRRLVVAFDDIEIGLSINAGCFPREPGQLRSSGVIVPLAAAASQLQGFISWQIVFVGTGATTSSVKIETFVTGVGKGRESNCINAPELFPTCSAHDVERLLSRLSLPDDVRTELSGLGRRPLDENMP